MFHVEVDWSFGVHPLIVEYVEGNDIPVDHIRVINENEILVLNNPVH